MVCVFVNLKQDTIVVEKRTVGGDGSFAFTQQPAGRRLRPDDDERGGEPGVHGPAAGDLQHQRECAGGLGADGCDL